ncbi:MAG: tRNA lysidine(34) synthetase TilS [Clostridiales bacterium]|nr:tRNA lysidine(34) synthetase TilS [Clostridiales bacterium]
MKDGRTKSAADSITDQVLVFAKDKGLFDCGIIVVGLSGGPDSVALLCILKELKDNNGIDCEIRAFHCNHHIRQGVCDEEADQVRELCGKLGIDVKVIDFDCIGFAEQNHISEETAGRLLRYEAFEQYAAALEKAEGKKVRIAIAHHKDDIAETMMMNLFRGSGLEGLVNPKSRTGRIIRPLLCVKKSELVDYLDSRNIRYAIDQTNLTVQGTRNSWRNRFLPEIGSFYNEDPAVPLTRTYKLLADDLEYINGISVETYKTNRRLLSGHPVLQVSGTRELHPAILSRIIRLLWHETFGDLIDFEEIHLSSCRSLMSGDAAGEMTIDMPFGRKAYRCGDVFGFADKDGIQTLSCSIAGEMGFLVADAPVKIGFDLHDIPQNGEFSVKISNSALKLKALLFENIGDLEYNNFSWFCPTDVIRDGGITFGNCSGLGTGLRMRRAGSEGSKEITRLMTDLKIPGSARKQIIFAEKDGEILWLPGFGHGKGFTDAKSRERYTADLTEDHTSGSLVMFTVERQ